MNWYIVDNTNPNRPELIGPFASDVDANSYVQETGRWSYMDVDVFVVRPIPPQTP